MKLIVGLGNPGSNYEYTRHNVGFKVIDELEKRYNFKVKKIKFKGVYDKGNILGEEVILLKPYTYMNDSGISIREALSYFKLSQKDLIVIYDDSDIEFGTIRIKKKGSAGTHNGMKSILYHIQSDEFDRVKLSIGKRGPFIDMKDFVLSGFDKSEIKTIEGEIDLAADAVEEIIKNGSDSAMNIYNGKSVI